MKFITKDGKSFDSYNDAIKHENNLFEAERIAKQREEEKANKYKELVSEFNKLNTKFEEYNKTYNDNIVLNMMSQTQNKDEIKDDKKEKYNTGTTDTIYNMLDLLSKVL